MPSELEKRRNEKLDYMHSMLAQLRTMANSERCDMLAYLIEMAYLEADDLVSGKKQPQSRSPTSGQKRNASS